MSKYLNIFNSFKNKANYHEDELTRVFLVTIKNITLAQIAFIDMIRDEMLNTGCMQVIPSLTEINSKVISVETQISNSNQLFQAMTGRRLVSIIISDDKLFTERNISKSERNAIYDGVIVYDPSWLLIIENKPDVSNVWLEQLNPNIPNEIEIEKIPVTLSWRKIIERFSSLIEKNMLSGLERNIMNDFLEFIDTEFPQLNPFSKLSICKDNQYLLNKRCIAIMEQINMGEVKYHIGWKDYICVNMDSIKQIALSSNFENEEWNIWLEMHPGDTMNQARCFYRNLNSSKFLGLKSKGWDLSPNMHFSFRASNLVWTNTNISIENYVRYWEDNVDSLGQVCNTEFTEYFKRLESEGMLSTEDWDLLNKNIINTNMQRINVCPGMNIFYWWTKKEATELDNGTKFIDIVKHKIAEAIETWS